MRDDKLSALVSELQAIELWDATEKPAHDGELEARRLRRLEIIREIDALAGKQIEVSERDAS
jgi:hypothetical protein